MSVEGLHLFKVIQILQKEFRLMGKLAEGEDTAIHGMLDEPRRKTSHQFSAFVRKSGAHCSRLESCQTFCNAFLLFMVQGEKRGARNAATVTALVHGVLYAGNAQFGYNQLRSAKQDGLQFARPFVVTLPNQFK